MQLLKPCEPRTRTKICSEALKNGVSVYEKRNIQICGKIKITKEIKHSGGIYVLSILLQGTETENIKLDSFYNDKKIMQNYFIIHFSIIVSHMKIKILVSIPMICKAKGMESRLKSTRYTTSTWPGKRLYVISDPKFNLPLETALKLMKHYMV